jgi:hypothetical protein
MENDNEEWRMSYNSRFSFSNLHSPFFTSHSGHLPRPGNDELGHGGQRVAGRTGGQNGKLPGCAFRKRAGLVFRVRD